MRAIWMPDGNSLLVSGHDGTRTAIWIQPLDGAAKRLDLGDANPSWWSWVDADAGKDSSIAFAGGTPTQPTELYYLASADAKAKRLTGEMIMPDGKVIAPTGKSFDLDFATTAKWEGDLLLEEFVFVDPALRAKQIGLA